MSIVDCKSPTVYPKILVKKVTMRAFDRRMSTRLIGSKPEIITGLIYNGRSEAITIHASLELTVNIAGDVDFLIGIASPQRLIFVLDYYKLIFTYVKFPATK